MSYRVKLIDRKAICLIFLAFTIFYLSSFLVSASSFGYADTRRPNLDNRVATTSGGNTYITNNYNNGSGWNGTATSNLNMNLYNITNASYIGIGTSTPQFRLDIQDNINGVTGAGIKNTNSLGWGEFNIYNDNSATDSRFYFGVGGTGASVFPNRGYIGSHTGLDGFNLFAQKPNATMNFYAGDNTNIRLQLNESRFLVNVSMIAKNITTTGTGKLNGIILDGDNGGIPNSYFHIQDSTYPIDLFDLRYVNLPPDGGTNGMVFNTYGQRYVWAGDGTQDLNIYNYTSVTINGSRIITTADNPITNPITADLDMNSYDIIFDSGSEITDGTYTSINPYLRYIYAYDGTTYMLDWSNNTYLKVGGDLDMNNYDIKMATGSEITDGTYTSIDPYNRIVYASDGTSPAFSYGSATAPQFNGMTTDGFVKTTSSSGILAIESFGVGDTYDDGTDTQITFTNGLATGISTSYDDSLLTDIQYQGTDNINTLTPITARFTAEGLKQYPNVTRESGKVLQIYKVSDVERFYPECIISERLSQWDRNITSGTVRNTLGREVKTYNRNCVNNKLLKDKEDKIKTLQTQLAILTEKVNKLCKTGGC